ncbi:hypothetical protein GMLC_01270 [Geomonas limicola]|uniref:Uncharacterized protein n=1 Tax=Geomonas limicola TaxID=2740186 RepID=A0A6V8N228_9BACT|nr:PIG-L family deacetylase [Geomonas limicola]GFO66548.1 hypothetical protein GMLC_01270 [Geomonas limicola]
MAESAGFVSRPKELHPELFPGGTPSDAAVPVRLPHYRLQGEALYFLTSSNPLARLDEGERRVWEAIDGQLSVCALRQRLGTDLDRALLRFIDLSLCELVPGAHPAGRQRVVVLEPHMDDAALSVGGIMWLRRRECEFHIVTLVGVTNFTTQITIGRDYFDPETVSGLRRDESVLWARHVGACHYTHPLREAPLRFSDEPWTLAWYQRNKKAVGAFVNHTAGPEEHQDWAALIEKTILELKPEQLWVPLGLGYHVDHELTRNAFLGLALEKPWLFKGLELYCYQDVPYAAIAPFHADQLIQALEGAGATFEEQRVDITQVMNLKLQLLTLFRSQFKIDPIRRKVEACGSKLAQTPEGYAEVMYRVLALPDCRVEQAATVAIGRRVQDLARKMAPWFERNHDAAQIRILVAVGVGRWAEDVTFLLESFPYTSFEIYLPEDCLIEAEALTSARIVTVPVDKRWKSWFANAVRILVRHPGPCVLISGADDDKQKKIADALGAVSIGSDTLVALTMNQLVLALRTVRSLVD